MAATKEGGKETKAETKKETAEGQGIRVGNLSWSCC